MRILVCQKPEAGVSPSFSVSWTTPPWIVLWATILHAPISGCIAALVSGESMASDWTSAGVSDCAAAGIPINDKKKRMVTVFIAIYLDAVGNATLFNDVFTRYAG